MCPRFKLSLFLNFILLCCLFLVVKFWSAADSKPALASEIGKTAPLAEPALAAPVPVPNAQAGEPPFSWRQVESPDYRTYVANLRKIACPEQTIRDIITADVGGLYARRREPLERRLAGTILTEGLKVEKELQELRLEEVCAITALLGSTNSKTEAVTASTRQQRQKSIAMPLVFQQVDVSALGLSPGQLQAIANLRDKFTEQIGGLNQDPNDPTYRDKWAKAQPEVDSEMRGMVGVNAFQNYQIGARTNAEQPTPSAP